MHVKFFVSKAEGGVALPFEVHSYVRCVSPLLPTIWLTSSQHHVHTQGDFPSLIHFATIRRHEAFQRHITAFYHFSFPIFGDLATLLYGELKITQNFIPHSDCEFRACCLYSAIWLITADLGKSAVTDCFSKGDVANGLKISDLCTSEKN